jgi:hypothetical protein
MVQGCGVGRRGGHGGPGLFGLDRACLRARRGLAFAVARLGGLDGCGLALGHDARILEQGFKDRPAFQFGKAVDEFAIAKVAPAQPLQQDLCICPHSPTP